MMWSGSYADTPGDTGPEKWEAMLQSDAAAAERERIKGAGAVSACCGASYTRPPHERWVCGECGQECDLIGVIV